MGPALLGALAGSGMPMQTSNDLGQSRHRQRRCWAVLAGPRACANLPDSQRPSPLVSARVEVARVGPPPAATPPPLPRRPARAAFSAHDPQYPQVASLGDECLSENQHLPFCWSGPPKIASAEAGAAEIRAVMATVAAAIVNCRIMPSPWFPVGFVSCSALPGWCLWVSP